MGEGENLETWWQVGRFLLVHRWLPVLCSLAYSVMLHKAAPHLWRQEGAPPLLVLLITSFFESPFYMDL